VKKVSASGKGGRRFDVSGRELLDLLSVPAHASSHQHGGSDEVATATAAANAIPKALGTGLLDLEWLRDVIGVNELAGIVGSTGSGDLLVKQEEPTLANPRINSELRDVAGGSWVRTPAFLPGAPVNAVEVAHSNTGVAVGIAAVGTDANINVYANPKGTGRFQVGGVNVPTISSTDTFTNKIIDGTQLVADSVAFSKLPNAAGQASFLGRRSAGAGDFEDIPRTGTAFPASPYDGEPFYRSDLDCDFQYDATRAKWLSKETYWFAATISASLITNTYMDHVPAILAQSATIGDGFAWDFTVVAMDACKADTSQASTIRFRRNGSNIAGKTFAAAADQHIQDFALNNDGSAASAVTDALSIFVTLGGITQNATGMKARFYVKRRAA
jgi:hypothetical protein